MKREIKFRAWVIRSESAIDINKMRYEDNETIFGWKADGVTMEIMQYTGFKNKNGDDVYEGDFFRIEENDEDNTVIRVVVVWVHEWAMFTTLRVEDEYQAYLTEGVDAIDETMFWTYTLEDIDSPKHYPCGNIFENPDFLNG